MQASEQSSDERKGGIGGFFQVVKRSVQEFSADDMLVYAAALSYQIFFSLFPFIIFILAVLGVLNLQSFFDWLLEQAKTVMPGQSTKLIGSIISQVKGSAASSALSLGAIIALYSASGAVRQAMHAMNVAYDISEERPVWKKFPLSLLYTLLLAVMLFAAVGLMLLGPTAARFIGGQIGFGSELFVTLWTWLRIPVAIVILMVVVAIIYYLFPNHRQPFRLVTPGAVLAVIVWILASLGFSWYVTNFSSYSKTYGSIAAIIVLLLYFFITSAILLFGAEMNAETYRQVTDDPEERPEASESSDT